MWLRWQRRVTTQKLPQGNYPHSSSSPPLVLDLFHDSGETQRFTDLKTREHSHRHNTTTTDSTEPRKGRRTCRGHAALGFEPPLAQCYGTLRAELVSRKKHRLLILYKRSTRILHFSIASKVKARMYRCCIYSDTTVLARREVAGAYIPSIRLGYRAGFKHSTPWRWPSWAILLCSSRAHSSSSISKFEAAVLLLLLAGCWCCCRSLLSRDVGGGTAVYSAVAAAVCLL